MLNFQVIHPVKITRNKNKDYSNNNNQLNYYKIEKEVSEFVIDLHIDVVVNLNRS